MRIALVLLAACVVACNWYPPTPHLDGTWRFRFDDMTDGHVQCRIPVMDVAITQSGSTFAGVQQGNATRQCITQFGDPVSVSFSNDTLSGAVGQIRIGFVFSRTPGSGASWTQNAHSGSVSGDVMLGRATCSGSIGERNMEGTFAPLLLPE